METINILCATDENYAPYCGIMLTSLFESNKDCRFDVFVFLNHDFSEINRKKFLRLGKKYGNFMRLIEINDVEIEVFPFNEGSHISKSTYYRLLASQLLPQDVHKIVYLDCDIIINGDVCPLWGINLDGLAIGAVEFAEASYDEICKRLGYHHSYGYFNAGVLVFNMDYWRDNDVMTNVSSFIEKNYDRLYGMDQDVLNAVVYDKKVLLPRRYNFMTKSFQKKFWDDYSSEQQQNCLEECDHAVIVHYLTNEKPWDFRHYGGPFYSLWHKYRRMSLWRDCVEVKPIVKTAKHLVKRYVFPKLLRKQRQDWVVTPENEKYYR